MQTLCAHNHTVARIDRSMNVSRRYASTTQGLPFMEGFHILGSGSIGLLFASCIRVSFPSYPLSILVRPHHEQRLQKEGRKSYLEVSLLAQKRPRMVRVPAQVISDTETSTIRHLLLTTKALDASTALESILHRLDKESSRIIILCNGALAVKKEIYQVLKKASLEKTTTITLASTYHGAFLDYGDDDHLYHVTHAGFGKTFVEDDVPLAQLWDQSGLVATSISSNEMEVVLWQKLTANCVINPITALLGCKNGEISSQAWYHDMVPCIIQELSDVVLHSFDQDPSTQLTPDALTVFVNQVIEGTLANKSSMYQDILRQQPTLMGSLDNDVLLLQFIL